MARQNSNFNMRGRVGDLVFYKSGDQFLVRSAPKKNKKKIKNDPAYECVRQNNADFSTAAKAGKLLRLALVAIIPRRGDPMLASRLTASMMAVLKTDQVNTRGELKITSGHVDMLKGFQFNSALDLFKTAFMPYKVSFDRPSGRGTVNILPVAGMMVAAPEAATHYSFVFGLAACNFRSNKHRSDVCESAPQPLTVRQSPSVTLTAALPPACSDPVFMVIGIRFTSLVNGGHHPSGGVKSYAAAIVQVDYPLK